MWLISVQFMVFDFNIFYCLYTINCDVLKVLYDIHHTHRFSQPLSNV